MEVTEKEIFDTNIPHRFLKEFQFFVSKTEDREYLTVFMGILLVTLLVIKNILHRRKFKSGHASYSDTLPYVQWIPFLKLPFLDSIILAYKGRKDGAKLIENIIQKIGRNAKIGLGIKTLVAISDPLIIQKLLVSTNPGHLEKNQLLYCNVFTSLMKDGLLASKYDTWSRHRNILAPAFKYNALTTYFKFINEEAKQLVQSATNATSSETDGVIRNDKMRELIDHHSVKIITHIIMGSESFNFTEEQRLSFHQSFRRFKEIIFERIYRPEQLIPFIWWMHPNKRKLDKEMDKIANISNQITDIYRKKMVNQESMLSSTNCNGINVRDSLQEKEKRKEEAELGIKPFECLMEIMIKSGFTNKEITDEMVTMLVAGHDTINGALDLLIFQLARNSEHQKKCQVEVDELFDSKSNDQLRGLEIQDFSNLKYLDMCILESLRITPTGPAFIRDLQEPLKLDNNYEIPKGEVVLVLTWVLHRNPEIYPNPETFDPNRFLPENVKKRHPYSFLPFSLGVRNCIGNKIALLEMKVIMAWILRHFDMHTTDGPNDVKLVYDVTLKPERPYNVTFTKRILENNRA